MPVADSRTGSRHAVDAGHDAAEQDLQRVADQRDLGGERAESGDGDEQHEEGEARDGVHDPGRQVDRRER